MSERNWHIHMARTWLAEAANRRRYPQHSGWHAQCLAFAAERRLQAAACKPEPAQQDLFGDL
jgi:hypothetical protein